MELEKLIEKTKQSSVQEFKSPPPTPPTPTGIEVGNYSEVIDMDPAKIVHTKRGYMAYERK